MYTMYMYSKQNSPILTYIRNEFFETFYKTSTTASSEPMLSGVLYFSAWKVKSLSENPKYSYMTKSVPTCTILNFEINNDSLLVKSMEDCRVD